MDYKNLQYFQSSPQSQVLFEGELSLHRILAFPPQDHLVLFSFVEPNDRLNCILIYSLI